MQSESLLPQVRLQAILRLRVKEMHLESRLCQKVSWRKAGACFATHVRPGTGHGGGNSLV